MLEYKCLKCKRLFEDSITQTRCPTFKCQSRQIKEINMSHKGVTLSNIEWCFWDEGQKYERIRDKQGQPIRVAQQKYEEELFRMAENEKTQPGATDDDALARAKKNEEKKQKQLQAIFDDNTSGRYGKGTDN